MVQGPLSIENLRKIAALEALAASTTFEGERANALAAIAKIRGAAPPAETAEEEEVREWARTIDAAESDRIISDMVNRAYRHLCALGCRVYRDGPGFVIEKLDSVEKITGGSVLNIAINIGFVP